MPKRKRAGSPSNGSRSGVAFEKLKLVEAQDALVDLSGLLARAYDFDHITERRDDEHLDGLREHQPADNDAGLQFARVQLDSLDWKRSPNERGRCFASAARGDVIVQRTLEICALVADTGAKPSLDR